MRVLPYLIAPLLASTLLSPSVLAVSPLSQKVADYAVDNYSKPMVENLANLVRFNTQAVEGLTPDTNPEFIGFKAELKALSHRLGLDYSDHGYVVLIGLGQSEEKLGVITHGDVQPADPELWLQSPYILDTQSEPGKLIGRGTEDDKGPIVTAMYAMKSIKDNDIRLNKRIELMVYMAEESDWQPLRDFLQSYTPANINITIDAEYPVVTAEKGWSQIAFTIPNIQSDSTTSEPQLLEFNGGSFASQVPQQAFAKLINVNSELLAAFKKKAELQPQMRYRFKQTQESLTIFADGKSTHSSTPEDGINAVTHLAELLSIRTWPKSTASLTQKFIDDMVGLGHYGEQFGDIAYKDEFMGAMSLAPTVVKQGVAGTKITINLRRPKGKTAELLDEQTLFAMARWQANNHVQLVGIDTYWGKPMVMEGAPHLETLLSIFGHYTDTDNPQPVAIGGSTNSKLFPNALSFGPAMPGVEYTGHSENEFITYQQFMLNLKMYTAAFIELAASQ
ncbi:dipeptidase, putative [Shewanella halifaxensis HAW-EB4]|uniref:Dipeptidase, putative n=1 Tax=Shewanella halifaxensis (strain HAW-EB4) TaxID=458817 RepID=B0TJJ1_SHEHH|nr:dipeptidase [Shewanella halifaxensis]ABZ76987.1 dipeptidase, putative [Shewanella halifaxensis HAW-EB4]